MLVFEDSFCSLGGDARLTDYILQKLDELEIEFQYLKIFSVIKMQAA